MDKDEQKLLESAERDDPDEKAASEQEAEINMCYLFSLLITISLGTVQFGYMVGSWNTAAGAYGKKEGWDEDEQYLNVMIV